MNKDAPVRNDETLYRSVRRSVGGDKETAEYIYYNGELRFRPKAFNDRHQKPSVDRAELREYNPSLSRLDETQGIVSLNAGEVRAIDLDVHTVDVIYTPTQENRAHSEITMTSECCVSRSQRKREFNLLKTELADIATENGWTLPPEE